MITFLLIVFIDLTTGVGGGILLAVLAFVRRMSGTLKVSKVLPDPADKLVKPEIVQQGSNCPQINIYTLEGPLFFGTTEQFEDELEKIIKSKPRVLILIMSKVSFIDTSGEALITKIVKQLKHQKQHIIISGIQQQPKELLWKTGLHKEIGERNFFEHTGDALNSALEKLETNKCIGCKQFAFSECSELSVQPVKTKRTKKSLVTGISTSLPRA